MNIGLYIKHLRMARGWSLRELARRCTISASTLSRIENGHDFQFSQLEQIAAVFGAGAGDLLVEAGYTTVGNPATCAGSSKDYLIRVSYAGGLPLLEIVEALKQK